MTSASHSPELAPALGTLGSGPLAHVGNGGTVTSMGAGWSLQWWVLAEDRLHRPDREAAVRSHLIDDAPVVETAMRVLGGDVVATAYGAVPASTSGDDPGEAETEPAWVVEIENRTSVPVAVVIVVGPIEGRAVEDRLTLSGASIASSRTVADW